LPAPETAGDNQGANESAASVYTADEMERSHHKSASDVRRPANWRAWRLSPQLKLPTAEIGFSGKAPVFPVCSTAAL